MSWKLFKFERSLKRRRLFHRNVRLRLEELEARVVPSTDVTAYHQASPVPSPSSTIGAGVNSNETILTPANVNATDFGKLFTTPVDGQVYAEPLYMENVNITTGANQGIHNVVFVATQHDSLYAIDANNGTILWQDALLTPEHGGTVTSVPNSAVNSDDISPEIGITATPVIDPTTNSIFVENKTQEVASDGTHFEHHLYAINIENGAIANEVLITDSIGDTVVSGPSVEGNGDGSSNGVVQFDALRQMDRPALTLVNGNIYLAFASHGDNTPYHGWILGYSESNLAPTAVFNANPNGGDDGIWQSGGTLDYETVNGNTYLYFETGNGTFDTTLTPSPFNSNLMIPNQGDYGDSFVKVQIDGSTAASGSLNATNNINGWGMHVVDYFTPIDEGNLAAGDTDLGSGAPLLLPSSAGSAAHPNLMVGSGKEGRIYLIDRDNMGGYGGDAAGDGNSGTDNVVQETGAGAINASFDTPTFFNGTLYYVGGYGDQARTFTVASGAISSSSVTQSTDSYPFPGSTATISTNPSGGNAIVWDIAGPGTDELRAYDASQGYSSEIYTSDQAANSRDALGSAVKFAVPTVADGQVFVGTNNSLVVYGLIQQATAAPAAPSNLSATPFSGSVINLNWTDNDKVPNTATGYNIFQSTDGVNFTQVGTASAGATSFAVGSLQVSTKYYFEINAFNAVGTSDFSNVASAATTSQISALDFSSGFAGSSSALTYNGNAQINGTSAELTDGGGNEAGSVFSTNAVDVTKFSNQFTFQLTNANADGFTFTIQGEEPTALGPSGGGLGYGPDSPSGTPGIPNSVAVKFDLYSNNGEGTDSTGIYTDGASPTTPAIDLTGTGIDLHSGDVFQVVMGYDGTTLNVTITDTNTKASASQSYAVNIPQVIGSDVGYVGFTGGTGGDTAVQNILTWDYSPTATTGPAAPTNLTGTVISGSEIDISWTNNANNATSILIDRSSDGVNFSQIDSVSASMTTYHDTSLSPGNPYYYEVQASNAAGVSAFSNVFQASTVTAPAPPTNLAATNITATEVDLSWTNVATNATGIRILKQLGNNSSQLVASGLAPTTTSYKITKLTPGSSYIFEVDATNSNGPSGAATIAVDTLPAQVTGVTAAGGPSEVTIRWSADPGAATYNVYRAATAGGEGTTPTWSALTGTSYRDATATPGTTYYYVVTAVDPKSASPTDPAGESARSAEVSAQAVTPTVTSVSSTAVNGTYGIDSAIAITVGFNAAVNVTGTPQGTPQLALNSGGVANYRSGSGTNTLTFTYTVGIGQNANPLDEASTTALSLNGGTITDTNGNPVNLTLPTPGTTGALGVSKSIVIDTSKPVYTYDSKGRLIGIDYPNGNVYSRTFNSDGSSMATLKNINGTLLYTYNYNVQNQITTVDYPNGNVLTYNYPGGVLATATLKDSNGNLLQTFNYNAQGKLTSIDYAASGNILTYNYSSGVLSTATLTDSSNTLLETYNYNAQGQVTSLDYANGNVLTYTYTNNVLSSATLKNSNGTVLDDYSYNIAGALTAYDTYYANGNVFHRVYASDGSSTATLKNSSGVLLAAYSYNAQGQLATSAVYEANGNILTSTYTSGVVSKATLTTSGGTLLQTYNYNAQGQVTSLVYAANGNVLTYTYTSGVLTSATLNASTANGGALLQTYNYNTQGQISSLVYANGNTLTFNYTSGVLSTATLKNNSNAVLQTYTYNAQGQVSSIKDGSGNPLYTYTYDALGRVSTFTYVSNGNIQTFTYKSDSTSSATLDTSGGTLIATYHYDVFGRVTEIDYANGNTYKRTYAANGTSTATLTNSSGTVLHTYTYDAQGNLVSQT